MADVSTENSVAPLLKRVFMFLEDGEWAFAKEYCERVLDVDPENASAYLGKLMAELRVRTQDELKDCAKAFDDNNNYQKVIRFADDGLKATLEGYIEHINTRNEETRVEKEKVKAKKAKRAKKVILIATSIIAIIVAFVILLNTVFIPNSKYNNAVTLMNAGKYNEAITAFKDIYGYKDSYSKISECRYNIAIGLMTQGKYTEAITVFEELNGYKDSTTKINECVAERDAIIELFFKTVYDEAVTLMNAGKYDEAILTFATIPNYSDSKEKISQCKIKKIKSAKVGECIKFGLYEQDNNTSNGTEEIEWIVLEVKNGKALVVSKYVLDRKPYDSHAHIVGRCLWDECTLQNWLNKDFIDVAFSTDEKALIPTVKVFVNDESSGTTSQDKIFILSVSEAKKYFGSDSLRKGVATPYVLAQGVTNRDGCVLWWLRTATMGEYVIDVAYDGSIHTRGNDDNAYNGIRPAMWIDLSKI